MIKNTIKNMVSVRKQAGLRYLGKLMFSRLIVSLLALPIAGMIVLISPWKPIRFVRLFSARIGHYAYNTELMLCALESPLFQSKTPIKTFFFNTPFTPICNTQLYKMWKRIICILPFTVLIAEIDRWLSKWKKTYRDDPLKKTFESTYGGEDHWRFMEKFPPRLFFTEEEKQQGVQLLHRLGIPAHAPFVCLLMRDSNYLQTHLPQGDWAYHDYRNVDSNRYKRAALYLAKKGFYVVRMGKYVKEKFEVEHPFVIDYANSPMRSDFLDIYLSVHCYFMISTSTGLDSVTQIFRRTMLLTDMPVTDLSPTSYCHLFVFKKLFDKTNHRFLSLNEIYRAVTTNQGKLRMWELLQKYNWCFIDNSPEEIETAVAEMLQHVQNPDFAPSVESQSLQHQFWQHFPIKMQNKIYTPETVKMQVGDHFLNQNQSLLFAVPALCNRVIDN